MITSYFQKKKTSLCQDEAKASSDSVQHAPDDDDSVARKRLRTEKGDYNDTESSHKIHLDTSVRLPERIVNESARALISHLTDESWLTALMPYVSKPSFASLAQFVENERRTKTVFPSSEDTFSALNLVPLQQVKLVVVGQDPYHQPGQGHGLAFSVRKGVRIPPSLLNIYKELREDDTSLTQFPSQKKPTHGFLEKWAWQGVLLLNTVLTVRYNEPNSHGKKGWEQFTDEVLRVLLKYNESIEGEKGIVFLLWGQPAQSKASSIIEKFKKKKHVVITSSHPSPLGATKTNQPFLGSKCFSRANIALTNMKMEPIDWDVDHRAPGN